MTSLRAELALDARAEVGEGPVWDDRTGTLLWVDIPRGEIHRFDPRSGGDEVFAVAQPVGALALRGSGGLVLALRDGFALVDELDADVRLAVDVERDEAGNRMNDGKCDRAGRFWAGTMALDYTAGRGTLYRLDPDLAVTPVLAGLTIPNGLAWSADDRTLYFVDSDENGIDVVDFDARRGALANRRRLVDIPAEDGLPDGMTIDADGFLWVALWGGGAVRRYSPDGALDLVVELPVTQVTSCAFGGERLDELYVTSAAGGLSDAELAAQPRAGGLFRVRVDARGLAPERFGG